MGYPVALLARNTDALKTAKAEIEAAVKAQSNVTIHSVDLTDAVATAHAIDEVLRVHKSVRGLVNNAGTWTGGKPLQELSHEDVRRSLDLNFFSAFNATKAVLTKHEARTGETLSIMNIGATSSLQGWDNVAAFCIAKGALRTYSQSLARELGPRGVHVSHLIIDGLLDNERTRSLNPGTAGDRFMNLESVANTILHVMLQQDRSAWTFEQEVRPYNENW